MRIKRQACEEKVNRALDAIERENKILECSSGVCYADIYGNDALEEGEIDTVRGRQFKNCARNEIREERAAARAAEKAAKQEML